MAPLIEGASRRVVEVDTADCGRIGLCVSELGDGPPALLLHGWPQHAGAWRKVAPLLAPHHRVICPDLRGFGGSDAPGRGYDPETFAADALALLDALGIERAFLIGHDWGGVAAQIAALRAPERVGALVVLNTPLLWARPSPKLIAQMWRAWYAAVMASPLGPRVLRSKPERIARGIRGDLVHRDAITREEAMAYARALTRAESAAATQQLYRNYFRAFAGAARSQPPGRLTTPARVLFGLNDAAVPAELVQGQEHHGDDLRVDLVEDSGHFICEEKPELVAERALELFRAVRAPG